MKVAEAAWQSKCPSPGEPSSSPGPTQNLSKQLCKSIPAPQANCPWAAHAHTAVGESHHGWPHGSTCRVLPVHPGTTLPGWTCQHHACPLHVSIGAYHFSSYHRDQLHSPTFWHETICHVLKYILGDTCSIYGTGWSTFLIGLQGWANEARVWPKN